MKKQNVVLAALLVTGLASIGVSAESKSTTTKREKPKESPGWVVIEEDFWIPWRFEATNWLHSARVHYRRNEERAAANEIRKAESWLRFAEGHAMPMTKSSLTESVRELGMLATDLEQGKLRNARQLDAAFARANRALAEWHYFKAKDSIGQSDEKLAAQHLESAARHLKEAAASANYEFGRDVVNVFDQLERNGSVIETVTVDRNKLADNLGVVERELNKMSETLKQAAK